MSTKTWRKTDEVSEGSVKDEDLVDDDVIKLLDFIEIRAKANKRRAIEKWAVEERRKTRTSAIG